MTLSLERLFDSPGEALPFEAEIDLFGPDADVPVQAPVVVRGVSRNLAGIVTVDYTADYSLDTLCDRCLDAVHIPRRLTVSHVAVRSLSTGGDGEDEYLVLPDAMLSVDEMVYADLILDLPSKVLCSPECRGLCPQCGANWNREACSCRQKAVDPRLRALEELLE